MAGGPAHCLPARPLRAIGRAIGAGREYEEVLHLVAACARRVLRAAATVVMSLEAGGMFLVRAVSGRRVAGLRNTYVPVEDTAAGEVVWQARPLATDAARIASRHEAALAAVGLRTVAYAPIPGYGGPIGVLQVARADRRRITPDDLRALELFALTAGLRPDPLPAYRSLTRTSGGATSERELLRRQLQSLTECAVRLSGATACAIYLPATRRGGDGSPMSRGTSLERVAEYRDPGANTSSSDRVPQHPAAPDRAPQHPAAPDRAPQDPAAPDRASQHPAAPDRASLDPATVRGLLTRLENRCGARVVTRLSEGVVVLVPVGERDGLLGALCGLWPNSAPDIASLRLVSAIADEAAYAIQVTREWMAASVRTVSDERDRLARRLHDSVTQSLYAITLSARAAREVLARDPGTAVDSIDQVLRLADTGLADSRRLIHDLQPDPATGMGLAPALNRLLNRLRDAYGVATTADLDPEPALAREVADALFLIAREALVNAERHAGPRSVAVRLSTSGPLRLEVHDDGAGFEAGQAVPEGLGLRLMRERAAAVGGRLEVVSRPGAGTVVRVTVPVVSS